MCAYLEEEIIELDNLEKQYKRYINKHFKLCEQIDMLYAVSRHSGYHTQEIEYIISLCKEDIKLTLKCKEYWYLSHQIWIKYDNVRGDVARERNFVLPNYGTFARLAIILEKQKNFDAALKICQQSIKYGYIEDGTAGKMFGRIARLQAKINKENEKSVQKSKQKLTEPIIKENTAVINDAKEHPEF